MLLKLDAAKSSDPPNSMLEDLYLKETPQGKGVFTSKELVVGTPILEFGGQLVSLQEIQNFCYVLEIEAGIFLSASGEIDDFVNHSCEPNCGIIYQNKRPLLCALKQIAADEQLTFDYSLSIREDKTNFECSCGSKICRKKIGHFSDLPEELKERYRLLGLVPSWLEGEV